MQYGVLHVEPKDERNVIAQESRLLDQVRDRARFRHYSIRTEQAYLGWNRHFILFHRKRHPRDMGAPEVEQFLSALATEHKLAASTQNQALSAILFLYCEVLEFDLPMARWKHR